MSLIFSAASHSHFYSLLLNLHLLPYPFLFFLSSPLLYFVLSFPILSSLFSVPLLTYPYFSSPLLSFPLLTSFLLSSSPPIFISSFQTINILSFPSYISTHAHMSKHVHIYTHSCISQHIKQTSDRFWKIMMSVHALWTNTHKKNFFGKKQILLLPGVMFAFIAIAYNRTVTWVTI